MNAKVGIGLAIMIILSLVLFPTILCLSRCAGCTYYFDEASGTTAAATTSMLINSTFPLCPGYWNGTHVVDECDCCGDYALYLNVMNVTDDYEDWENYAFTTSRSCNLPNQINVSGLIAETAYTFNATYCALVVTCPLWNIIQLIPVFYIIGTVVTTALVAVYASKKT